MSTGDLDWRPVMEKLLRHAEVVECFHEETYRAGAIWTVCNGCGARWADDAGGPARYVEPAAITAVRDLLAATKKPQGE